MSTSLYAFKSAVHSHLIKPVRLCLFPAILFAPCLLGMFLYLFFLFFFKFIFLSLFILDFWCFFFGQSFNLLLDQYWVGLVRDKYKVLIELDIYIMVAKHKMAHFKCLFIIVVIVVVVIIIIIISPKSDYKYTIINLYNS